MTNSPKFILRSILISILLVLCITLVGGIILFLFTLFFKVLGFFLLAALTLGIILYLINLFRQRG